MQEGSTCTAVDGGLTLFTSRQPSDDDEKILLMIKKGMSDGSFVDAHEAIISISFMEETSFSILSDNDSPPREDVEIQSNPGER
eukprot:9776048-Ditylum_brightwellii.AAC.1